MKGGILLIAILLGKLLCLGQQLPTKQQYDFIRQFIKNNPTSKTLENISDTLTHFENTDSNLKSLNQLKTDLNLGKSDVSFLLKQLESNNKIVKLDTVVLSGLPWKSQSFKGGPINRVSLPLFSKNGKMAFIYWFRYCGYKNFECYDSGIYMYKKTKSKWICTNSTNLSVRS